MNNFPPKAAVEARKTQYLPDTRVELISMDDPYTKLKPGERGSVILVDDIGTVHIRWDSGSMLGAALGADEIRVVTPVSDKVYAQIMAVRSAGQCNMLDTRAVQRCAHDHDMYDLVIFIEEHKPDYVAFIMHGVRE